jgi:hypothetical protein
VISSWANSLFDNLILLLIKTLLNTIFGVTVHSFSTKEMKRRKDVLSRGVTHFIVCHPNQVQHHFV